MVLRGLVLVALLFGSPYQRPGVPAERSTIAGVVFAMGKPVQNTAVLLVDVTTGSDLSTSTDAEGRFRFPDLREGRYVIHTAKHGYVMTESGTEPPTVEVRPGVQTEITLEMLPSSTISGNVRDEYDRPLAAVLVSALGPGESFRVARARSGEPGPQRSSWTNARGDFRIEALPPGQYLVAAFSLTTDAASGARHLSEADVDLALDGLTRRSRGIGDPTGQVKPPPLSVPVMVLAPAFFPGTTQRRHAQPVSVGVGEDRENVNFMLAAVPASTLSGRVLNADGAVELNILPLESIQAIGLSTPVPRLEQSPSVEGAFRYANVIPGSYLVMARQPAGSSGALYGAVRVEANGFDVSGVAIGLDPGATARGEVARSSAVPRGRLQVSLVPSSAMTSVTVAGTRVGNAFAVSKTVTSGNDGSFTIANLPPGAYEVRIVSAAGGVIPVAAVTVDGVMAPENLLYITDGTVSVGITVAAGR